MKHKILVVEDEVLCQSLYQCIFSNAGFDVLIRGTVKDSLNVLKEEADIAVALIDEGLPDGSGREIAAAIVEMRKDLPREQQMPFILMSGTPLEADQVTALGASSFIQKPDWPKIPPEGSASWVKALRAQIPPAPLRPKLAVKGQAGKGESNELIYTL